MGKGIVGDVTFEGGRMTSQGVDAGSVRSTALGVGMDLDAAKRVIVAADGVLPVNLDYTAGKWLHMALGNSNAAAGLVSLQNSSGKKLFIMRCLVEDSTPSAIAATGDFGVAATAILADNLLDGIDLNAVPPAGIYDNNEDLDRGLNGSASMKWAAGAFFTGSTASGDAAGLAGMASIYVVELA